LDAITPIASVAALKDPDLDAVRRQRAFESLEEMFVSILLKEMRKSIPDGGLLAKSHATKMYEEMMDEAFATQMAKSGQMGIAKQLSEQWRVEHLRETIQAETPGKT
jgi:Rod binding domain-containing protein